MAPVVSATIGRVDTATSALQGAVRGTALEHVHPPQAHRHPRCAPIRDGGDPAPAQSVQDPHA